MNRLYLLPQSFKFDSDLLKAPKMLTDIVHQFQHKKEIFDLKERHNNNDLDLANKNSLAQDIECTCKIQWDMIIMVSLSLLGILVFLIINARN